MKPRAALALFVALALALLSIAAKGGGTVTAPETGGLVVFRDACYNQHYLISPDGTGRQVLNIGERYVLDVSRGQTPVTILAARRVNPNDPYSPSTLDAITIAGKPPNVVAGTPMQLIQTTEPALGGYARLSPDGTLIAYIYYGPGGPEVVIGDGVRDANGNVIDLVNITDVAALFTLPGAQRSDSSADSRFVFTGDLDFAPDGLRLVVVIYDDLWLLQLAADGHTLVSAVPLTRTRDSAEREPRWSPGGDEIAFSGGPYTNGFAGRGLDSSDMNIYALDVTTGAVRQVTTSNNEASSGWGKQSPNWSPSGTNLLYSAEGRAATGRRSWPCSGTNSDLFQIRGDGSQKAVDVTKTVGTGIEVSPGWGW